MSLLPDSPIRLIVWLVATALIADALSAPQEAIAGMALLLAVIGGWLMVRRRRAESSQNEILGGTNTPLYTYGLLGFGLASALGILGLLSVGFDVVERVIAWEWDGFDFTSLYPLLPAAILAAVSVCSVMLHVILHLNDEDDP